MLTVGDRVDKMVAKLLRVAQKIRLDKVDHTVICKEGGWNLVYQDSTVTHIP